MIKKYVASLLLLISPCIAKQDPRVQYVADEISFFYLNQNPEIAPQVINDLTRFNKLDDGFYFFAALARTYPRQTMKWLTNAHIDFQKHPTLINALQFGGLNGDAIRLAQKTNWPPKKIMGLSRELSLFQEEFVEMPGYVPCLSAHFSVSGDVKYGKKIIDLFEIKHKTPVSFAELQTEAKAELCDLIFKHDRIYRLCLEEMQTRTESAQAVLKEIVDKAHAAHEARAFPEKNGMFTGHLLITDDPSFEEQWDSLPAMGGPVCKQISSIPFPKENKEIKVFLLMDGFELSKDLDADVTYDVEITDPNGELMGKCDNLLGLKRKLPNRFFLQKADQPVGFKFSMEDKEGDKGIPSGVYTVKATVKDHISGKDLKLCSTLEVLPEK